MIGRGSGKFLTFALHMRVLIDPLLEMSDFQYCQKSGKRYIPHKAWRGVDPTQLFPFTQKDREDYAKMARLLTFFLPENVNRKGNFDYFAETKDLDYTDHEFFAFFESANRHLKEKMRDLIGMLGNVGQGQPLPDYHNLIQLLGYFEAHGLAAHSQNHRGCF